MHSLFIKFLVTIAHAQGAGSIIQKGIDGCTFTTGDIIPRQCIPNFIAHLIQWLFAFAGSVCLIMIMWGGYEIVAGNLPGGSAESGKNRITWAIIGFILCATSFYILDFIIVSLSGSSLTS